jgi:hypothetical protein
MNELNRLANELEAEQFTMEDVEQIIKLTRQRIAGYTAGDSKTRVKTESEEKISIWDIVKKPEPSVKLVRRRV